jgi:hypothetical protein
LLIQKSSTRNFDRLSRPLGPPSTRQAHKISPSRLSKKERDTRHFSGSRSKQLELEGALLADKDKVGYKRSHRVFGVTPSEENFDPADKKIEYEKNILKRETEELTKMVKILLCALFISIKCFLVILVLVLSFAVCQAPLNSIVTLVIGKIRTFLIVHS